MRSRILLGTCLALVIGFSNLNDATGAASLAALGQKQSLSTKLPPASREGWWVRINGSTDASYVYLRFGAAKNKLGSPITRAKTDADSFDVPAAERSLDAVEIAALVMPPTAKASICLFYRDEGIKLVEFVREQNLRVERAERAPECRP